MTIQNIQHLAYSMRCVCDVPSHQESFKIVENTTPVTQYEISTSLRLALKNKKLSM